MMLKNREIIKLFIFQIIIFIGIIISTLFITFKINEKHNERIINTTSSIVGNAIKIHPDLQEKIITNFSETKNSQLGYNFLEENNLITSLKNDNQENFLLVLIPSITAFAFLIIINFLFLRKTYNRIKAIDKSVDKILQGNYQINIKDYHEGDISSLKNNIYKMTVKLRETNEQLSKEKNNLEELLEDISHQIKTPLTSMYMINDILQQEENPSIRQDFLDKNETQIKRIEWLVSSLLKMSRLDNGSVKLKTENVNIEKLIDNAIFPINAMISNKCIKVTKQLQKNNINCDYQWTSEAILNIIKNACEHTKDQIIIQSSSNPLYTEISIEDNGQGISKKDMAHLFERFYRGNHNKESIGIGLSMSKKIIELQNGTIEVTSKVGKGSIFTIKFYKN